MKKTILLISLLSLFQASCEKDFSGNWPYIPPDSINDGFVAGSLEEVNIDAGMIAKAVGRIHQGKYKEVHSMLIYKDNRLVFEEYFQGHVYKWDAPYHHGELVTWNRDMVHNTMSATKSIVSACIGIAIDHGFIESVHQSIFDYLPDHQHLSNGGKEKITIEHLLTMTSGLEWREWSAPYSSTANPCIGIWFQEEDPISYILEMPLVDAPGSNFNYSTGHMNLLGEIIRNASGMTIDEFSSTYLFGPLGIDTADWYLKFENGIYDANNLRITPRAMTKFGATFLNNGVWNGNRIVSKQWVEKSAVPYSGNQGINVPGEASGRLGYSYTWWTREYAFKGNKIDMYTASGFGGQYIMILPELNTVVVFTCGNYLTRRPPFEILERFILPAIN
ncbi:serine hydrolase domain-containing protein [Bacteroidota bacterium]